MEGTGWIYQSTLSSSWRQCRNEAAELLKSCKLHQALWFSIGCRSVVLLFPSVIFDFFFFSYISFDEVNLAVRRKGGTWVLSYVCRDLRVGWDCDVWLILGQRFAGWKIVLVSFSLTPWTCKMIRASSKTTSWIRGQDSRGFGAINTTFVREQFDRLQDGFRINGVKSEISHRSQSSPSPEGVQIPRKLQQSPGPHPRQSPKPDTKGIP